MGLVPSDRHRCQRRTSRDAPLLHDGIMQRTHDGGLDVHTESPPQVHSKNDGRSQLKVHNVQNDIRNMDRTTERVDDHVHHDRPTRLVLIVTTSEGNDCWVRVR